MTTARGRSQVERSKDDARGAEPKSGTLLRTPNGFFAQFSIGGGQRKGTLLRSCATEEDAEKRKAAIARLIGRLREAGYASMIPNTIRQAGKLDDEGMAKLARLVERIAEGKEPGLVAAAGGRRENLTVQELADLWTTGKLAEEYPDHVRSKRSSDADARMLGWLSKVRMVDGTTFGDREVANVTLDDCDHVMRGLPKTAESPASRRQYAQALRKLLVYAVYPLRLRETLPIPKGWLPKTRSDKAKAWIYPSEDLALMQCREVPLVRRLFYGLLVREGLRVTEALALTWADLDLERGVLRLDANKTDDPRSWALGEDVARALALWKKLRGKKAQKVPRVFPKALIGERWPLARAPGGPHPRRRYAPRAHHRERRAPCPASPRPARLLRHAGASGGAHGSVGHRPNGAPFQPDDLPLQAGSPHGRGARARLAGAPRPSHPGAHAQGESECKWGANGGFERSVRVDPIPQ